MPTKDMVVNFMDDFTESQLDAIAQSLVFKVTNLWNSETNIVDLGFTNRVSGANRTLLTDLKSFSKQDKVRFISIVDKLITDINARIAKNKNKLTDYDLGQIKSVILRYDLNFEK